MPHKKIRLFPSLLLILIGNYVTTATIVDTKAKKKGKGKEAFLEQGSPVDKDSNEGSKNSRTGAVIKLNEIIYDIPEEKSCSVQKWKSSKQDTCQCCLLYKKDKLTDKNSADDIIKGCINSKACSEEIIKTIKKAYLAENISSEDFIAKLYNNSIVIRTMNVDKSLMGKDGNLTEQSLPIFLTQAYNEKKLLREDFSKVEYLKAKNLGTQGGNNTLQLFLVTSIYKPSQ